MTALQGCQLPSTSRTRVSRMILCTDITLKMRSFIREAIPVEELLLFYKKVGILIGGIGDVREASTIFISTH